MDDKQERQLKNLLVGFFSALHITVDKLAMLMWLDAFRGLEYETVRDAFLAFKNESTDIPTPARVRKYLGRAGMTPEDRALVAWSAVRSLMLSHGAYYRAEFTDDPTTHAAIRAIGGWVSLCGTPADQLTWKQKEFTAAYVQACRTGIGDFRPLAGIVQGETVQVTTGLLPTYGVKTVAAMTVTTSTPQKAITHQPGPTP